MVDQNKVAGVYKTHAEAVKALQRLQEHEYAVEKKVVIVGHGAIVEDHLHLYPATDALKVSALFGGIIGGIAGALVISMVPDASLAIGALPMKILIGASLGILIGTAVGMFITLIIGEQGILRKKKHFEMEDYTLEIRGNNEDIQRARHLLGTSENFETLATVPA